MNYQDLLGDLKEVIKFYRKEELSSFFIKEIASVENRKDFSKSQFFKLLAKYFIQFIFKQNLTIMKYDKKYKNTIRHIFPRYISPIQRDKTVDVLRNFIDNSEINVQVRYEDSRPYFAISDFTSIINIIFCWRQPLFDLNSEKKKEIKKIFRKNDVRVYFKNEFMEKIFGPKGLLDREELSIPKFLKSLNMAEPQKENKKQKGYTRQHVNYWKREHYLPIRFLNIVYGQYEDFDDYFEYIEYVQLGKSTEDKENKIVSYDLLKKMITEVEFLRDFIPTGSSNFGYLFRHNVITEKEESLPLSLEKDYEFELGKKFKKKTLKRYEQHIDLIKSKIHKPDKRIAIISVELTNFRSYVHEKIFFENGLNILYGMNGSGKTTILEAILFTLLRLHPLYSLTYIPHITNSLSPEFILGSNTWLIQIGKPSCQVDLVLKVGREVVKITRTMKQNGFQEIKINDITVFNDSEINEEDLRQLFIKSKDIDSDSRFKSPEHIKCAKMVYEKFQKRGILFDKDEIFTSFFSEFQFFWNWESYFNKSDQIIHFYTDKFGLTYLDNLIENKKLKRQDLISIKNNLANRLKNTLTSPILFDLINKNKWFKIQSGECSRIVTDSEVLYEDSRSKGISISIEYDRMSSHDHSEKGVYCQKCGEFYCWDCIVYRGQESCTECDEEGGSWSSPLLINETLRREYGGVYLEEFFHKDHQKSVIEVFKNDSIDHQKSVINKEAVERLNISFEILKNFEDIFAILKYHSSDSEKDPSSIKAKIKLPSLKRLFNLSQPYRNLELLTYYTVLLLYIFYNASQDEIKVNYTQVKGLETLLSVSKERIHKKMEEFQLTRRKSEKLQKEWKFNTVRKDTYEFELRIFRLLYYIFVISDSKIFTNNFREKISTNKFRDEILKYTQTLKEFVQPGLEIVDTPLERHSDTRVFYKDYQKEWVHIIDYKVLSEQLENMIKLLQARSLHLKEMDKIDEKIIKRDDEIFFLEENFKILRDKVYLEYLSHEIKEKSPKIFDKSTFYGFIDEKGIPMLYYYEEDKNLPISILSNGEISKLFLAILGILLSLSNRNMFLLIDEPNEFLDPENVDTMKEYFLSIFKNKQLIISTFIKKYKQFQPALRYEVKKRLDGSSKVEKIDL